MKSWKKTLLGLLTVSSVATGMIAGISCGRPDDADLNSSAQGSNYIPVDGLAAYGTQCPYGDVEGIKPLRMQMWNCPLTSGRVRLNQDLSPLYLQADCKTRILTIRTLDRKIDTSWYFLPNGEFDVIVDGITARLDSEGSCNAPLAINMMGKVECGANETNLDKATIRFQSVMWAGKRLSGQGNSPVVTPSPQPSGLAPEPIGRTAVQNPCNLPSSCYFYTQAELKQCQ